MDQKEQMDLIRTIIAEEMDINPQDIDEDTTLEQDLDMDAINIEQVLAAMEVEFDIEYEKEDYEDMKTVGDLLASLENYDL